VVHILKASCAEELLKVEFRNFLLIVTLIGIEMVPSLAIKLRKQVILILALSRRRQLRALCQVEWQSEHLLTVRGVQLPKCVDGLFIFRQGLVQVLSGILKIAGWILAYNFIDSELELNRAFNFSELLFWDETDVLKTVNFSEHEIVVIEILSKAFDLVQFADINILESLLSNMTPEFGLGHRVLAVGRQVVEHPLLFA